MARLRDKIDQHFTLEEIRLLCFDLGMEYEHLGGETRPAKIQSLIEYLEQRGRLSDLLHLLSRHRPEVTWDTAEEQGTSSPFKGLQYFSQEDAAIFFGREAITGYLPFSSVNIR